MRRESLTVPSGRTPEGRGSSGTRAIALLVFAAVGGQAAFEGAADALLVVGAAELDELAQLLVVALYVGVGGHRENIQHWADGGGCPAPRRPAHPPPTRPSRQRPAVPPSRCPCRTMCPTIPATDLHKETFAQPSFPYPPPWRPRNPPPTRPSCRRPPAATTIETPTHAEATARLPKAINQPFLHPSASIAAKKSFDYHTGANIQTRSAAHLPPTAPHPASTAMVGWGLRVG